MWGGGVIMKNTKVNLPALVEASRRRTVLHPELLKNILPKKLAALEIGRPP